MPKNHQSPLVGSNIKTVQTIKGYPSATTLPMTLMFGQPNNYLNINLNMEDVSGLSSSLQEIFIERIKVLDMSLKEGILSAKNFFKLDSRLSYELPTVPYSALTSVRLPNIIGLKAPMKDFVFKLNECLELTANILEYELASLSRLVGQLLTEPNALTSPVPLPAFSDLKQYTNDVYQEKAALHEMLGYGSDNQFIEYGNLYYSNKDWEEVSKLLVGMSNKVKKINVPNVAKRINNATVLMEKLVSKLDTVDATTENVKDFSKMVEVSSNNIAFAGATLNLVDTTIQTFNEHNNILTQEVKEYKLIKK